MSLHGDYDSQNIFAQIIRGEAPSYTIYEDEDVLAFLDLFPQSYGHTLIIPKRAAARNILDIDPESLCKLALAAQKLTRVLVDELQPDGVQLCQFNGAPSGQTVFHIHVHLIPRYTGQAPGPHGQGKADPAVLEALAARLASRIRTAQ
ncbi:HIT family protein [Pseudomonas sp. RIT-PI-AD]|uniref:HIT family protein n=1 Tax=Pseudomonas sp. RIT-PI-AD TaxID=3035294 RepID=UPI0021D7E64E|nr:HIT family protein [Pseudomonas sp. RIT-PI-AD]